MACAWVALSLAIAKAISARVEHVITPTAENEIAAIVRHRLFDRIDEPAQDWYEGQHRLLRASGADPYGPRSIDEWRVRHPGLHPHDVLLAALRERYDERALEWVPYLYRWLGGPASEALEQTLVDIGAFPAIGYRWAGSRMSTTRSSAPSR